MPYRGEVAYLFAYDIAYDLDRVPLRELLGQPVAQFSVDASRRAPKQLFFHQPAMIRLPPLERQGPRGALRIERTLKILPVGALSITARVAFEVDRLEDLVDYHDLRFANGSLAAEIRVLAESALAELRPHCVRPAAQLEEEEAYTVFCLRPPLPPSSGPLPATAERWLEAHRRTVAALLMQEEDPACLSEQEVAESTGRAVSYYESDLVVVDWDAALVVETPADTEPVLHGFELASVQLTELEAYDRLLDEAIERAYRDLRAPRRRRAGLVRDLQELRIDMARLHDELGNITKFFGDWHLARLYQNVSARFHLDDWCRSTDSKLRVLDEMYQMLKHDENNRWMLILEGSIVVLFILDLIIIFFGKG